MAVLVGIDEAGYGPILGPLVVSGAVFEMPDSLLGDDLWDIFRRSVARQPAGSLGRIVIGDSKKLHRGKGDYRALQRSILACIVAIDDEAERPVNMGQLLSSTGSDCNERLDDYPWYKDVVNNWPLRYDDSDISIAALSLRSDLAQAGINLAALWARPMLVGRFNELLEAMDNKASVSFFLVSQLIDLAFKKFGERNLQIVIDRQGGRVHYRNVLQRIFEKLEMKVLRQDESTSSYQLAGSGGTMKLHFLTKAEDRQLPVALASMLSKYTRELFIEILNDYFRKLCPDIAPTAGYYKDGKRFLADLQKAELSETQMPKERLVRQR